MNYIAIYDVNPSPKGDHYRLVSSFNTREDAVKVLKVLEEVNIDFHYYRLFEYSCYNGINKRIHEYTDLGWITYNDNRFDIDAINKKIK